MANKVQWIKVDTNMFDDAKMSVIELLPNSDTVYVIWLKLLILAAKEGPDGVIYLAPGFPVSSEYLSKKFSRDIADINVAMETFFRLGMIEETDSGGLCISNFAEWQDLKKLHATERKRKSRAKVKQIEAPKEEKFQRLDHVWVSLPEEERIIAKYGRKAYDKYVLSLDDWFSNNPDKLKKAGPYERSDSKRIQSWMRRDGVKEVNGSEKVLTCPNGHKYTGTVCTQCIK
jgi:predicted phage replisome organizer